jgi:uncharacterized protein
VKNPKFEMYTDKGGAFRFRLKARNGQNILASEGYSSKPGCKNGIESVKKNAVNDKRYRREVTDSGKFYFVLIAGNNEPIGTSQMYQREPSREKGIEAVKRVAADAPIDDMTG